MHRDFASSTIPLRPRFFLSPPMLKRSILAVPWSSPRSSGSASPAPWPAGCSRTLGAPPTAILSMLAAGPTRSPWTGTPSKLCAPLKQVRVVARGSLWAGSSTRRDGPRLPRSRYDWRVPTTSKLCVAGLVPMPPRPATVVRATMHARHLLTQSPFVNPLSAHFNAVPASTSARGNAWQTTRQRPVDEDAYPARAFRTGRGSASTNLARSSAGPVTTSAMVPAFPTTTQQPAARGAHLARHRTTLQPPATELRAARPATRATTTAVADA